MGDITVTAVPLSAETQAILDEVFGTPQEAHTEVEEFRASLPEPQPVDTSRLAAILDTGPMATGGIGEPGSEPDLSNPNVVTIRYQGREIRFTVGFATERPADAMTLPGGVIRTPVVVTGLPPDPPLVEPEPVVTRDIFVSGGFEGMSLARRYFRDNPAALETIRVHLKDAPVP